MRLIYEIIHYLRPDLLKFLGLPTRKQERFQRVPIREILHPEELDVTVKHENGKVTYERIGTAYLEAPHIDHKTEVERGLARQERNDDWKRRRLKREYKKEMEELRKKPWKKLHMSEMSNEDLQEYSKILKK